MKTATFCPNSLLTKILLDNTVSCLFLTEIGH